MRRTRDSVFLEMALVMSARSTCARRRVGCILTDEHGHVLATGYNGVPRGWIHCTDVPCEGAASPTTTDLDLCKAIHAEANALLQCADVGRIHTAYCTDSPCVHCVKLLLNTGCQRIVFRTLYDSKALALWVKDHRMVMELLS